MDLPRDRRTRLAFVAGALVLVLVGWSLTYLVVRGLLTDAADCKVEVGQRTVVLTTDKAEVASIAAARAVRLRSSLPASAKAVAKASGLSRSNARFVALALTGRARQALSCTHGGSDQSDPDRLDRSGLTHRAERVRQDLDRS